MRRAAACVLALLVLVLGATPALAGHDDHGPGAVLLSDRAGADDRVQVTFPDGADAGEVERLVSERARAQGLRVRRLEVAHNTAPDTERAVVVTTLADRTGLLARRVPADRLAAWRGLGQQPEVHLTLSRWARDVQGLPTGRGQHPVTGNADIAYRLSAWTLLIPALVLLAAAVVPCVVLRVCCARLTRRSPSPQDALHGVRKVSAAVQLVLPLGLLAALLATGTHGWVDLTLAELAPGAALPSAVLRPLTVLGLLLPVLLVVVSATVAVLPTDRRLRGTTQTQRAGVGQALRAVALVLVPVLALQLLLGLVPGDSALAVLPLAVLFPVALIVVAPLLLNAVLTTAPLDQSLRERLLASCTEQGLRVRDVRLIDSRGGKVGNAAISGVLPGLRYVYLTDELLKVLDDDELEAVLAHEIGHGKGHHLLLKLGAVLLALVAVLGVLLLGVRALDASPGLLAVAAVALLLPVVVLLVLGVLGVALEQRADDHAVRTVGAAALSSALEKLAEANAVPRHTGWLWNVLQQHPGLDQRLRRLSGAATTPSPVVPRP